MRLYKEKIAIFFATGFYSGFFPIASGTVGSFVALVIYWIIPGFEKLSILIPVIIIYSAIGIWSGTIAEKKYGHDPSEVVIDEMVGMWITLILLPKTILISIIAFVLCRFFDIVKPAPAYQIQKLKGGYGIMLDDVVAGFYSLVTTHIIIRILSWLRYI